MKTEEQSIINVARTRELIIELLKSGQFDEARNVCVKAVDNPKISGDIDDFHLLSLEFYRVDDYQTAFEAAKRGVEVHTNSPMLTAAALLYSYSTGQKAEADKYYKKLIAFPKAIWNWRCFAYAIDYLMSFLSDGDDGAAMLTQVDEAILLAEAYQKHFPYDEKAYDKEYSARCLKYNFYIQSDDNKAEAEKNALDFVYEKSIKSDAVHLPSVAVKHVQFLLRNSRYDDAIAACEKLLQCAEVVSGELLSEVLYSLAVAELGAIIKKKDETSEAKINDVCKKLTGAIISSSEPSKMAKKAHLCRCAIEYKLGSSVSEELVNTIEVYASSPHATEHRNG